MARIALSLSSASCWKVGAVFLTVMADQTLHQWCYLGRYVAAVLPWGHPSPAAHSPDILTEGPWVPAGGERVPLHLHMRRQLSVQTEKGLFTSSFWRKEEISGDILIPFYEELFLDSAAASHIKCFVSFDFSLNCIISVSAPWHIMAVLFAESLIISSGLLSEDQFISSGLWSLKGNNCSC